MARIKNMGASTVRFNEGVIVSGSASQPDGTISDYSLIVSGTIKNEGNIETKKITLTGATTSDITQEGNTDCLIRFRRNNDFPGIQVWNGGFNMLEFWQDYDGQVSPGSNQGAVIINQNGNQIDFRVETDNNPNAIYTDGTNDKVFLGGFQQDIAGDDVGVYISGSIDSKLVVNADMVVTGAISFAGAESGLILSSPNGTMFVITVDNDGSLGTFQL